MNMNCPITRASEFRYGSVMSGEVLYCDVLSGQIRMR